MNNVFKEEAVPLIYFENKTQKYTINNEAIDIIKAIPAPIGVISVVGMYRTGKSYLMNRMILNKQKGFGVGPTVNPCTKGLWIWGTPIKGQQPDGSPINIIVIDTEGIGALDEDSNHDTRVFSLAVLLSSLFIYNSVGSIDENAIQNLSLVVSLTKHIQIKSSAYDEQLDSEDYAKYFPTFLWIIRDFTLQLIDQDGEPITSKEYLDNSLQLQNGFSDDIEQKNRIRRLLLTFFQDRDCFTMVRPLLDETNLQNLENISINKLRPEFTEQIMQLRKKTIQRMRPKLINGKQLSGENFSGLIICYNEAINNGSIPNIESSWQYICRDENQKAQNYAEQIFDQQINENIRTKLPLSELELKIQYKSAKDTSLQEFKKKVMGDDYTEYISELKQYFRAQMSTLEKQNEEISNQICQDYVQQEYAQYDKQLKSQGFQSFNQFYKAIQQFQKYLNEKGPNLKNSQIIYCDFIMNCVVEAAMIFNKQLRDDIEINKQLLNDRNKKLEQEVSEIKKGLNQQIGNKNDQINSLELQLQQNEQEKLLIQKQFNEFKKTREQNENLVKKKLDDEKAKQDQDIVQLKLTISQIQDQLKEKERNFTIKESDFLREKALFQQKLQFMDNTLNEFKKKELENDVDTSVKKSEMESLIKDIKSKHDSQLKSHVEQISELQEKNYDHQLNSQSMQERIERDTNKFNNEKKILQKQISDQLAQIQNYKNEIQMLVQENQDQINKNLIGYQQQIQQLQSKLDIMQNYHKDNEEEIKTSRISIQNKTAIMQQKQQFLEMELENVQNQLAEEKRQHEATIQAFQFSQTNDKSPIDNQYVLQLKEKLENEQKRNDETIEDIKKRLQAQIAELTAKNNDLEFKLKYQESDSQKECAALKEALSQSEQQRSQSISLNKSLEKQQQMSIKEIENRTKKQILLLEAELEEFKIKEARNQREQSEKSEIELENLKKLYEVEKQKLEKRLQEDKRKYEQTYQIMVEEYELRDEQNQLEEEQEQYNQEIQDLQLQMYSQQQHSENEIQMKINELDIKEQTINELSNQLNDLHEQNNLKLQQLQQQQQEEKLQLSKVVDLRGQEIQRMEKESMYLKQQIEHLEQNLNKKEQQIEQIKNQINQEKQIQDQKQDEQRKKQQSVQDEYLENKINYEKEIALSKQQIEFLQNKLTDLQKLSDSNIKKYDQQLKTQKEELLKEFDEKQQKIQLEKDNSIQKNEQLKKQSKSKESQYAEKLNELEKERLQLQDRLYQQEHQFNDQENKNQKEIQSLKQKLEQQQKSLLSDKQPLKAENDKLKAQVEKLEVEKSETQSLYERDKVLWEQKFVFLQNQKEQAKKDHEEAIRKFNQTLIHMSMIRKNQESEVQQNLGEMLNTIEKKYQVQIQDLNESHNRDVEMFEDKIRKLEKELSNVSDKMLLDSHGKWGNQYLNEKKFNDMLENEKQLLKDIQELKSENEKLQRETYKQQEQERDNFKQKLYEVELKAKVKYKQTKESENRRSHLIYEHEKQRAQWNLEKDHLTMKNNELQDNFQRLERKKEILLRENEKLKADCKLQRRTTNTTSLMSNQGALNLIRQSHIGNLQIEQAKQSALNESQQHLERFSLKLNSSRFGNQNTNKDNNTSFTNQYNKDENILNESLSEQDQPFKPKK